MWYDVATRLCAWSYWLIDGVPDDTRVAVAQSLFTTLPRRVLNDPARVFASIDGPDIDTADSEGNVMPADVSTEFTCVGVLWSGAQVAVSDRAAKDGITQTSNTRLYRYYDDGLSS